MSKKSTLKISDRFDEYPEITQADIDRARFRVNLQDAPRKQRVNIMLDTGIIAFFKSKAGERGYQTLINAALKQAIQQEELETTLRRIVREELANAPTEAPCALDRGLLVMPSLSCNAPASFYGSAKEFKRCRLSA